MHFPSISNYVVQFITLFRNYGRSFVRISFWISKTQFFFLFLIFHQLFCSVFVGYFREVNISFTISKGRNLPLLCFFVPLRVIDDGLEMILRHQHIKNSLEFFDFFLLIPDCIEQLFLFIFMFILNISQLSQIHDIFLFYFCKSLLYLIYLFIETFIIFFYI